MIKIKILLFVFLLNTNLVISEIVWKPYFNENDDLKVVQNVDIERYLGEWYEIARFDQRFQKNCVASTATYEFKNKNTIRVINRCKNKDLQGKERKAKGTAWITDKETNAKLRVRFFWPFSGKYWIIELDEDYQIAVVGHPNKKYLWILSRNPEMKETVYSEILERIKNQGYDLKNLIKPPQRRLEGKNIF